MYLPAPPSTKTKDFAARTTFGSGQKETLRSLAEALFSPEGEVPPERLDAFPDEVDAFMAPASRELKAGLRILLVLVWLSPIVVFYKFATFDGLPVEERVAVLDRLDRSPRALLSLILAAYKTILTMLFFEHPTELLYMGYPGPERHRHLRGQSLPPLLLTKKLGAVR